MKNLLVVECGTTNICNARCLFCPHYKFEKFGTMSDELYEKIINQASKLPNLRTFIPMLTGEPFCDKQFLNRLRLARERMPLVSLDFYTNGSLLTREIISELKSIPNVHVNVSLNAATQETRKQIMGLDDYRDVLKSLEYMSEAGLSYKTSMVGYPEIKLDEIKTFSHAGGTVIRYQSWCGEQYPYTRNRPTRCGRVMNHLTIFYTGKVHLCCFDPFGKVVFGDLNNQTIEEVWMGIKKKEYQSLHSQWKGAECELCCSCTEG